MIVRLVCSRYRVTGSSGWKQPGNSSSTKRCVIYKSRYECLFLFSKTSLQHCSNKLIVNTSQYISLSCTFGRHFCRTFRRKLKLTQSLSQLRRGTGNSLVQITSSAPAAHAEAFGSGSRVFLRKPMKQNSLLRSFRNEEKEEFLAISEKKLLNRTVDRCYIPL